MNGGQRVAEVLARHGVRALFTLCGGHIAPILVGCHQRGIRVIDVRDEASAVFAADAVARLTGIPGVAAVTAGPGVTNTLTAITNARLAQSPLVLLGGATAGILKGRGALQDIDQMALMRSQVKWSASAARMRDIPPLLTRAFARAQEGVPGPVFVELPIDLLYDETLVREWFGKSSGGGRLLQWYVRRYLRRLFEGAEAIEVPPARRPSRDAVSDAAVRDIAGRLTRSARPVIVIGSQAVLGVAAGAPPAAGPARAPAPTLAAALETIGAPVFLSGMSRGLLGADHRLQMRHRRREALRKADLVILAGVPADFRLNYGRDIGRSAVLIAINRSDADLKKNRRPEVALHADPAASLIRVAEAMPPGRHDAWISELRASDGEREEEIAAAAGETTEFVNPLRLCQAIERALDPKSIIVADGGDFVSTASYIVRPRTPLSWLDPGPFGTLGVGAGFALGAAVSRPDEELWMLYGDGAVGFTLAEFDTFARHRIPVIAVVANDGCWSQIHREQIEILGDDTGCILARTDYHVAAQGLGGCGLLLRDGDAIDATLQEAKRIAAAGRPVLVNAWIGRTAFRKGSISM